MSPPELGSRTSSASSDTHNSSTKDLNWLHSDDEPRVQERQ